MHQGKLWISFYGIDSLNRRGLQGEVGYLYHKDSLIQRINFDSLLDEGMYGKLSFMLPASQYNLIIEGCFDYPIIYTGINVRKKIMNYLIIDIEEIIKEKITSPNILIIDFQKNSQKSLLKFPTKVVCTVSPE